MRLISMAAINGRLQETIAEAATIRWCRKVRDALGGLAEVSETGRLQETAASVPKLAL